MQEIWGREKEVNASRKSPMSRYSLAFLPFTGATFGESYFPLLTFPFPLLFRSVCVSSALYTRMYACTLGLNTHGVFLGENWGREDISVGSGKKSRVYQRGEMGLGHAQLSLCPSPSLFGFFFLSPIFCFDFSKGDKGHFTCGKQFFA